MGTKEKQFKTVAEEQISLLYSRMIKAEETDARADLIAKMFSFMKEKKTLSSKRHLKVLAVGAGGSYPAAQYLKLFFDNTADVICDAETPQTALRSIERVKYDLVIAISYSCTTPDIVAVYHKYRIAESYNKFFFITGENEKVVKDYIGNDDVNLQVISYYNEENSKEKGVISFFGAIEPCFLLYNGVYEEHKDEVYRLTTQAMMKCDNVFSEIVKTDANPLKTGLTYVIHVIYEPELYPAALDLEAKIKESGIAIVALHEAKNFSHGAYLTLYKQNFDIVINMLAKDEKDRESEYQKTALIPLLKEVCEDNNKYYLHLSSDEDYLYGNLSVMMFNAYFINRLGSCMNEDVSLPYSTMGEKFPKIAKNLYYFKGEF